MKRFIALTLAVISLLGALAGCTPAKEQPEVTTIAPETDQVTEPATEPVTEPITEPITEPETTEAPATEAEPQLEAPGCSSSITSAAVVVATACALFVLKKKEN